MQYFRSFQFSRKKRERTIAAALAHAAMTSVTNKKEKSCSGNEMAPFS